MVAEKWSWELPLAKFHDENSSALTVKIKAAEKQFHLLKTYFLLAIMLDFFFFIVLRIEPRASCMLDKSSAPELHPASWACI